MEKRELVIAKVKDVIAAPTCCAELKAAAEEYLTSLDTEKEKEAGKKLLTELEEDVQTIDAVLAFFTSEDGVKFFGADTASALAEQARKVKAEGGRYCFCPACTAGSAILDMKDVLL